PYANGLVLYLEHEIYILSSVICYLTIHYIVKICIDLLINYDITLLFVVRSNSIKNPQVFSSSHILLIPVLILCLIFAYYVFYVLLLFLYIIIIYLLSLLI